MAKSKSKSSGRKKSVSSDVSSDAERRDELRRKAAGNTLHAQQADYFAHRAANRSVVDGDMVLED